LIVEDEEYLFRSNTFEKIEGIKQKESEMIFNRLMDLSILIPVSEGYSGRVHVFTERGEYNM